MRVGALRHRIRSAQVRVYYGRPSRTGMVPLGLVSKIAAANQIASATYGPDVKGDLLHSRGRGFGISQQHLRRPGTLKGCVHKLASGETLH